MSQIDTFVQRHTRSSSENQIQKGLDEQFVEGVCGPAALGAFMGFVGEDEGGWIGRFKGAGAGTFIGAIVGVVVSAIGMVPIAAHDAEIKDQYASKVYQDQAKFLKEGQTSPFSLLKDNDGNISVEYLGDEYNGKTVTFDFSDTAHPKITTSEQIPYKPVPTASVNANQPTNSN